MTDVFDEVLLPGLPIDLIRARYATAPGNEVASGKLKNPESSAALVANAFGLFLDQPAELPALPGCGTEGWPARCVDLEVILRFPWAGGRHPCLDVVVRTDVALIGIESKRFEPFRAKNPIAFSDAYSRNVWGDDMPGYKRVHEGLGDGSIVFTRLDAAQLVKHAFGIRTAVHRQPSLQNKKPILLYLYAEPEGWPDGRPIRQVDIANHREEVRAFAGLVASNEVVFVCCTYRDLLSAWSVSPNALVRSHAEAVSERFAL